MNKGLGDSGWLVSGRDTDAPSSRAYETRDGRASRPKQKSSLLGLAAWIKSVWHFRAKALPPALQETKARLKRDAELVRASHIFDSHWYLSRYPDVARANIDPVLHFLSFGNSELRDPGPKFSTARYLVQYPDVATSGIPALVHYLRHGAIENRQVLPSDQRIVSDKIERPGSLQDGNYESYEGSHARFYSDAHLVAEGQVDAKQYVPPSLERADSSASSVKTIAFYLPQFHPIPENDKAWGKGFTEWTNVSKAIAEFEGHYQPHLPGELGFYDLRLRDVLSRQVELAKHYGVHAFCFHHYWFAGKRLLERPVSAFMADTGLQIGFCLCWANENWTRRWDGSENDIIIGQEHSPEDDIAFIADLAPAFADPRYVRVESKPILIVYRPTLLPDPSATARRWREYCRSHGYGEIFLIYAQTFGVTVHPAEIGFDAAVQFPPHGIAAASIAHEQAMLNPNFAGKIYDYRGLVANARRDLAVSYPLFETAFPSWDNSPRVPGRGHIYVNASPLAFREWLGLLFDRAERKNIPDHRIVFINAWNEWAEGAHLEPDRRFGHAWLTALASVVREKTPVSIFAEDEVAKSQAAFVKRFDTAVVVHLYYEELISDFIVRLKALPPTDIMITLPRHVSNEAIEAIRNELSGARIELVANRGRDVLPFLGALRLARDLGYDYLVKIHSKKSPHRTDGEALRARLVDRLLDPVSFAAIHTDFARNRNLGIVGARDTLVPFTTPDVMANNMSWVHCLMREMGLQPDALINGSFFAGTMFWVRVAALEWIKKLDLTQNRFEPEYGQIDGTLAHGLERIFVLGIKDSGFEVRTVD